jgi:pimeloyl-ACP methyl ester carboxylesterase
MPSVRANEITIEYETFGDSAAPPVLLIMGLGGQLIRWDASFCAALANAGYFVIRFDNRDVGLSTWFDGLAPDPPPYSLVDMADDAAGLLDALGIRAAHVVGASMGGMIAQTFAITHPERTLTLVSIMSTTGDRSVGQPTPEALAALMAPRPATREEAIELGVKVSLVVGSPGYPQEEQRERDRVGASFDRAFNPQGFARQFAAINAQPDRTQALGNVRVPTLVIHGAADPLVTPSGGQATADAIPGAQLKLLPGMGHDLPPELFDELVDDLATHFRQI